MLLLSLRFVQAISLQLLIVVVDAFDAVDAVAAVVAAAVAVPNKTLCLLY